jgi:inner membrane protein involved in colicin E2 resistance
MRQHLLMCLGFVATQQAAYQVHAYGFVVPGVLLILPDKLAQRIGVAAAARELGLYESQLYTWRSKQQQSLSASEREQELATENARLATVPVVVLARNNLKTRTSLKPVPSMKQSLFVKL